MSLAAYVATSSQEHLGQGDGVLVFDLRDFLSPAVSRSVWQTVVWASGQSRQLPSGHVFGLRLQKGPHLVDQRLFLPKEWTKDKARLDKAGVPKAYRAYRTRHQLALELLAKNGAGLPHGWISGDDEMGRPYWFRRDLPPWVSATCWRSRRTRPCVIWKPSP